MFYDELKPLHCDRDRPLSFHWRVDQERIDSLGLPRCEDKKLAAVRSSVLTEAMLGYDEEVWTSYSRREGFYAEHGRYHGTEISYTRVVRAIDQLLRFGLIEEERSSPKQRGQQSRFRATPKLLEGLVEAEASYEPCEPIVLRDADKKVIGYHDTDLTRRMRREMDSINDALGSAGLAMPPEADVIWTRRHMIVDGTYIRRGKPYLRRVFNRGSFHLGGRAYGSWQSLPKSLRCQLLIDGEPVAEPDFAHLHASIAYHERGHRLDFDPYETGDFERDHGKLALNIALNAADETSAIRALLNQRGWPHNYEKTRALLRALKRRNPIIADDLHADRGIQFMNRDASIILRTTRLCLEDGFSFFPVHDSGLTPVRHESRAIEFMRESADRVLVGLNTCKVRSFRGNLPHNGGGVSIGRVGKEEVVGVVGGVLGQSLSSECDLRVRLPLFSGLCAEELGSLRSLPLSRSRNSTLAVKTPIGKCTRTKIPTQLSLLEAEVMDLNALRAGGKLPDSIRRAIRDRLLSQSLRQDDLAQEIGLSRPQTTNVVMGRFGIGQPAARRLAAFLEAKSA